MTGRSARVVTIGVYGFSQATFLAALDDAGVRLLLDVRQRRGVRGSEYAWANSVRLQEALAERRHRLPPPRRSWRPPRSCAGSSTARTRGSASASERVRELAPEYRRRYTKEILDRVDLAPIVESLPADAATALLCVERDAEACHRSLIAERMAAEHGVSVRHLTPPHGN